MEKPKNRFGQVPGLNVYSYSNIDVFGSGDISKEMWEYSIKTNELSKRSEYRTAKDNLGRSLSKGGFKTKSEATQAGQVVLDNYLGGMYG